MVEDQAPDIIVAGSKIDDQQLARLTRAFYEDMVKVVIDIERDVAAVGEELHVDAEELLLAEGSRQSDLWGANDYPGHSPDACIECTSLINIRPAQGNRSMLVEDETPRARVRELTFTIIGRGGPLS